MSAMRITVLSLLVSVSFWLPVTAAAQANNVVLPANTSPQTGSPGVTTVSMAGSGFPTGTISPASVTVTLTPKSGGTAVTTTATSVTPGSGTKSTVAFLVPASISVTAATVYEVSIAGVTTSSTTFQSSNSSALTIDPPALIQTISPAKGLQSQTLSITITGKYSNFVNGTTQANFGPDIAVGGAAAGANGPVTVTSATKATASIVISNTAAVGNHNVTVVTGVETASLANGFVVDEAAVALTSSTAPKTGTAGSTISVTGSGFPSGTISPASVTVTLKPKTGGTAVTTPATSVTAGSGSTSTVGFLVPSSVSVTTATAYTVSIAGVTTTGIPFQSSNTSALTIDPLAVIQTISPTSGLQAQTLTVTITGKYTNFVKGTTQANFGPDIAVGGAAAGANGPVTVTSTTKATANIVISNTAALGSRSITAYTGSEIALLGNGFAVKEASVALGSATSPTTGQAGITSVSVTGSGFPSGTISPGSVTVTLTPKSGGAAVTTPATSVTAGSGTTNTVAFLVPSSIFVTAATVYEVSIAGATTTGTSFQSSKSSALTIDPEALIQTLSPTKGLQGQTLTVTITGKYTHFVNGTTQANFGPGVAVGGAAVGASGPVTVTSATKATASIDISNAALVGSYTVIAATGAEIAGLVNGFSVTGDSTPPVAVPGGPYSAQLPAVVQFNGSSSYDPTNKKAVLTFSWNFGDGTALGTGATPTHAYAQAGTFNGSLVVTNSTGVSGLPAPFVVTITGSPKNPIAAAGGPYSEKLPTALQLNGSGSSDPNTGATLTYSWNFGDGTVNGTGVNPTHTYAAPGTFNGTLTVSDNFGLSSTPSPFTVTVTGAVPVAVPGGPYSVQLPAAVQFDGSHSSDPNTGATLSYSWNFGDGTTNGTGAKPTHTYPSAATYNGTLTVSDNLGLSSTPVAFTVSVTAAAPGPQVTISSPTPLSVFNAAGNPVAVKGTIDNSKDVVTVNGVAATVSGGSFSSTVTLREGQNVLTATAVDTSGNVGTASETVTLNTTPPQLGILAPADGSVLTSSTITVAGNVNEQVPGTINALQVNVVVNGIAATVSNRTFSAANIPLVQGKNVITVVATDPAGNTSQSQVTVTYMGSIPVQTILKVSGELQTAAVATTLPQPLVIQVVNSNGAPVPNQQVTFSVVKSDGMLTSSSQQGQQVTAITDQNGQASVQFALGSRVGVGNNQVAVTAPGYTGQALFCENSTVGAPTKILVEMGDAQTGIIGQALPSPMVVGVFDAGGNPVAYQQVTFAVSSGGGTLNGNSSLNVSTDINGMASAILTLGQQEGTSNNSVSATFTGNTGPAASFVSSGQAGGPASITSISGMVEDDSNTAVPGATIALEGTTLTAVSDANGNFVISPAPIGTFLLQVNGHTSTRTDATFPTLAYSITTVSGINNTLGMPICLPPLDPTSVQTYSPTSTTPLVLQMTGVPGYTFTVAPNSVFNPDGTPYSGPLSLSQVHADRVPMAPPHGSLPLMAGTLQPPGLHFNPPVQTQFPNVSGLAPGIVLDIYSYDHDQMDWVSQGPARVSADGSVIVSDPGFGISKSGWHFPPPPPPPPKCASACTTKNPCQTSQCVNGACVASNANEGGTCSDGTAEEQCGTNGKCKSGACTFDSTATDGQACTPEDKCTVNAMCKSGTCTGTPYDTNSTYTVNQTISFPTELISTASEALEKLTAGNLEVEPINLQYQTQAQNCCSEESGQVPLGKVSGQGTGQLAVNAPGLPIGPALNISLTVIIPFVGEDELMVKAGFFLGAEISLNGTVGYVANQCESNNNCFYGQVNLAVEPQIYGTVSASDCITIYGLGKTCESAGIKAGLKVALNGGIRENSTDSCDNVVQGFASIERPTVFLTGSINSYSVSFQYQPPIALWPGWTCTWPGTCMANAF